MPVREGVFNGHEVMVAARGALLLPPPCVCASALRHGAAAAAHARPVSPAMPRAARRRVSGRSKRSRAAGDADESDEAAGSIDRQGDFMKGLFSRARFDAGRGCSLHRRARASRARAALAARLRDLRFEIGQRQTLQRAEVGRGEWRSFEAAQQLRALAPLGVLGRERRGGRGEFVWP
ncbi:MAG: hypothetical protein U1F49_00660 [Rubrivivax sp.]